MPSLVIVMVWIGLNVAILAVFARHGLLRVPGRGWTANDDLLLAQWARTRTSSD
jgi:hypothetical protein